jgi:imidazolonepropionase-like amidohydrolase
MDAGVDLMQHCSITGRLPIPDALLERLKTGSTYCAIQAITNDRLAIETGAKAATFPPRVYWDELMRIQDQNERRMITAGIPVLLATDAGIMSPDEAASIPENFRKDNSTALGQAHFLWFKATAEKGMKPMDAIVAATRNVARAYRKDAELGTLEPGKRADLLLLAADPLADIANVGKIDAVIKDGVVVNRAALPMNPILTKP